MGKLPVSECFRVCMFVSVRSVDLLCGETTAKGISLALSAGRKGLVQLTLSVSCERKKTQSLLLNDNADVPG